jgi:hypothetical protein
MRVSLPLAQNVFLSVISPPYNTEYIILGKNRQAELTVQELSLPFSLSDGGKVTQILPGSLKAFALDWNIYILVKFDQLLTWLLLL